MNLNPLCVFVAESIEEADVVATWLGRHGIRAEVINRNTCAHFEGPSLMPPNGVEVWVLDSAQAVQAIQMIEEHELQWIHVLKEAAENLSDECVSVTCEECGRISIFLPQSRGSCQLCQHCDAYVDVGGEEDEVAQVPGDEPADDAPPSDGVRLPPRVRPESDE